MSGFDQVEFGYNIADETINFGTRSLADGDNLYESATLASLKSTEANLDKRPQVNSLVKNGHLYVSINDSIKVFETKECEEMGFNANFEAIIDCFCLSPDGKFMLIFLESGMVHIIDVDNNYGCVFSENFLIDNQFSRCFISCFVEQNTDLAVKFLLVSKIGKIHRISINLEDQKANLLVEEIVDFQFTVENAAFSNPFLLVNGDQLALYNVETGDMDSDDCLPLRHILNLTNMALALQNDGSFLNICLRTLLCFPIKSEFSYKDVLLIPDSKKYEIIGITIDNCIQLISYPTFCVNLSVQLQSGISLVLSESINDELLYITEMESNKQINELRICMIYETKPEKRLDRLLRKQKFEEAEIFVKLFNLDKNLVYKYKAQLIIDQLCCSHNDILNLINILNEIDNDDEFRLQACIDTETLTTNRDDIRLILNYGCTLRLKNKQNKFQIEYLQNILNDLMFRFETFVAIYPKHEQQDWMTFSTSDLISDLKLYLRNHEVEKAIIIYSRLDTLSINNLNDCTIKEILNILDIIPPDICKQFLPTFIPITLALFPCTLEIFINWVKNRIIFLEKKDSVNFPENGIQFTKTISKLLNVNEITDIQFQRQRDCFSELSDILVALEGLQLLKNNYCVIIPLLEYLKGPRNIVRNLLNLESDEVFLEQFLLKFMLEHNLKPNEIFMEEIINMMQYEEKYWIKIVNSILKCIPSVTTKLEAIKVILNTASVPWSSDIHKIAKSALNYSHFLVSEIIEIIESEPLLVVLRDPKYQIKIKRIDDVDDLKFLVRRIIYCNEPTMVEDCFKLFNNAEYKYAGTQILIDHFIQVGDFQQALSLLDKNDDILRHCQYFIISAETAVNNKLNVSFPLENYNEIVGSIVARWNSQITNKFEQECNLLTLNLLRNTYNLKKKFHLDITTFDLRSKKNSVIADKLIDDLMANKIDSSEILVICQKISVYLSLDFDEVLIKLCSKCENFALILKSAQVILQQSTDSKKLCLAAVLLLKSIGSRNLQFNDDSNFDISVNETNLNFMDDCHLYLDGLKLAEEIVGKALIVNGTDTEACMAVFNWINTSFYLIKDHENWLENQLFDDLYSGNAMVAGYSTFDTIHHIFDIFSRCVGKFNSPVNSYLTYFNDTYLSEEELIQEIKLLPLSIETLCKEDQHFTAFKLLNTLKSSLIFVENSNLEAINAVDNIIKINCLPTLLKSLLSHNSIDINLLFNLLLLFSEEEVIKFIKFNLKFYKRRPKKFCIIAQLGIKLWNYHNITQMKPILYDVILTVKWWNKIIDHKKLNYDKFFKSNVDQRLELLMYANCLNVDLIKEYCTDFNLGLKTYYLMYLKILLIDWKPDYDIKTDLNNRKVLIVKNNQDDLLLKCNQVKEIIDDNELVFNLINTLWHSVNYYYYEIYIVMLNILLEINAKNKHKIPMLLFLKNYQRVSKPSASEVEQWCTTFPDRQSLDVLSEYRLPFMQQLFTKEIWNIIRPELNLKTYKRWFGAIDIVQYLNKDDICCFAIKEVVSSGVLQNDGDNKWNLHAKFEDLFNEIDECLMNINDLERATSAVYYVMTHMSNGGDQVNAARLCYKYALRYRDSQPESAEVKKAFIKMQKKFYNYTATHILYTYNLADERYLQLVTQPKDLIIALYSDERILRTVHLTCPKINETVDAIGVLFNINVEKIRIDLINNWVMDAVDSDLDASISVGLPNQNYNNNFVRALYICSGSNTQFWQNYLFEKGLGDDNKEEQNVRAKALKLFAAISDNATILRLTELNNEEFVNFVDKLTILGNLQYLGINLDTESLDKYNKKELLSRLMQRVRNPLSIKTMAIICMAYTIYNVKYWEFIINGSIKFQFCNELKVYVHFLNKEHCRYTHFFINAWQKIIDHSFTTIKSNTGNDLDEALINNFLTIQSCPVLYSLNFENAFKKCMQLKKTEFAAVLLQYIPANKKTDFANEVLQLNINVEDDLNRLSQNGIWGISLVKSILIPDC